MAKSVEQIAGVTRADVNFATGVLVIEYDPASDPRARALSVVRAAGHQAEPLVGAATDETVRAGDERSWLATHAHAVSTAVSGVLIVVGWLVARAGWSWAESASVMAYAGAILAGGSLVFRRAVVSAKARSLDMNVLMSVAVLGAAGIGEWAEGATVVFLFAVGGLLESRSLARTRRSIRDLMQLSPRIARVARDGVETEVPADSVAVGELMVVRPGERLALDGRVEEGASAVDESPITGESVPADKQVGDPVFAGSLNTSGRLAVRVTALAADSTLGRIIFMVEEAQATRAPAQQLVDRFSRYYTPAVIALAAVLGLGVPLVGSVLDAGWGGYGEWFYRALVVLVVSCPCALVISTPVSIVSAITRATRDGVLVKGGAHLETAARIRVVAFDKTGTLTAGRPEVTDVVALGDRDAAQVLARAAVLESHSNHPLARAIVRAYSGSGESRHVDEYEDVPGGGVRATVGEIRYAIGSPAFARAEGASPDHIDGPVAGLESEGRTALVLVEDGRAIGVIGVADQVRSDAPRAVADLLRGSGVGHVVMLTGDNERTAAAVASQAGVPEYRARLLPHGKVEAVHELREQFGPLMMVGDGINDAPALAAADLGIAMGAAGSDTALETADVALMSDDLMQLRDFVALGRRTVSIIRQNVVVSLLVKFAVLGLAMTGSATLWMAVFADTGVSLLVIANGMRLLTRHSPMQDSSSKG